LSSQFGALGNSSFQTLWEDGDRTFFRVLRKNVEGEQTAVLAVRPTAEHPTPASLNRLAHEYDLREDLDSTWAVRPLELVREGGRTLLLLEDLGGEPLDALLGAPLEVGRFLRLAVGIVAAVGGLHHRGLVHKDLKPANILVNRGNGEVKLTGFGIASRLPRERQAPAPPETIAGTFAYMAPEQTGRMNRSIDARSDLYSLGVTFYQMLTGSPPFAASAPMEWFHCHIARKPVPPHGRLASIPAPLSAIVMKLLAKTAEERYQTAGGIEHDLRCCLNQWETQRRIDPFPLGERDIPDRLLIPEKLYGRERERETLLASFERIIQSGAPELVLVSGYSGIGKSSVVNELHKVLVPPRGLFAAGKFDQYKRDIPYSTLVQAFQSLVRLLLGKSEGELSAWRDAFLEALFPNARLMVELVPELKLIIGEQPPVPTLPPQLAQTRFQLVFRRFVGVFAQADHPLALFLDDLQWLDAATLDLLEDLLTRSELRHLMLIGAYRENEVDAAHPLTRKLDAIKHAGGKVETIRLAPLAPEHVVQLIAEALRCEPEHAAPLARLLHTQTGGNPFFVIQSLYALAEKKLLAFDYDAACWSWDLDRIRAEGYTDDVLKLMIAKLTRLPVETRYALEQMACLGNNVDIAKLSIVLGSSEDQVHAALWTAVRQELIERLDCAYKFAHDRVQEAAYSLIPESLRAETHLRIGRRLAAHTPPEERDMTIFDLVNQLNRGVGLITSREEREQLAELNLIAGQRAKASTAYASALAYFVAGAVLLAEDCWSRRHALTFALELQRAECEFLTGAMTEAEGRLIALSTRAVDTIERATVACLTIDLYTTLDQSSRAVAVGLDYLRHLGIDWSMHPTEDEMRREYARIWSQLGNRTIDALLELPVMVDPASLGTLDVLTKLGPPALFKDENLFALVSCRAVNLSIERGNSDGSCIAYALFGMVAGARFGDHQAAYRFGQLGHDLIQQRGLKRFEAGTYMVFSNVVAPWTRHIRAGRDLLRQGLEAGIRNGDIAYAAYAHNQLTTNFLAAGDRLSEAQRQAEKGVAFAQKARFGFVVDLSATQLGMIRTLRGLTPSFGTFDDEQFDELQIERRFAENPDLALAECWYWTRKLQARFLAGDYAAAVDASSRVHRLQWTSPSFFEMAEYHFYGALSHAASYETAAADERCKHRDALADHQKQLQIWAKSCPENFENRTALIGAEIARIEGRDMDAMHLYEEAIRSAGANGFIHNEAIANEVAARFYASRGLEKVSRVYLRDARYGYLRWGADGKVRQLDEIYPHLEIGEPAITLSTTVEAPVDRLDLATVIKVSQAVSGEIVLEKLIETLMRTAIEQAGAERGLLMLTRGASQRIAAQATTRDDRVIVQLCDAPLTADVLPEPVLHYVLRTGECVILDDAATETSFAADTYINERQARSILCLPLINQGKLMGALYLENNLAPRIFAPGRVAVVKLLASQAAITLENARLYRELAEREAKIRRLVDANIVGIYIWDLDGQILEANEAFLRMVGCDREDLVSGRMRWTDLTPAEWLDRDMQRWVPELVTTGTLEPFEKEYFRKDGSRVPVLIGVATFEEDGHQGVAFVLDLTERKAAEAEARESERRYREVQMELAHANRAATMGQLTASIAHEVRQPIAATATNAVAALRWLSAQPPNLEETRQSLDCIVKDAMRADGVVGRIRDLFKKAPSRKDTVDVNEAVREVIELVRGEAVKYDISLQTVFADGLPLILGDRVQLQQVILNLIVNAIEAMATSEGPRELLVSTAVDPSNGVSIAVRDSGPGLSAEAIERVFDPFYTTKAGGLGMGLSICRSIVEAHGGRLWAQPSEPRGAVFQFILPSDEVERSRSPEDEDLPVA
jgi:PAS domain S-box-containing protein